MLSSYSNAHLSQQHSGENSPHTFSCANPANAALAMLVIKNKIRIKTITPPVFNLMIIRLTIS